MFRPIYEPKGRAKEYGDLCINIYTGCPHRCYYCFAPAVLHMDKEKFHSHVEPRKGIVEAVKKQIAKEGITGKLIHLCFTCDPYPIGVDTTVTREIIKVLKDSGNHVQILTKSSETRDLDLLDENDWYGVTVTEYMGKADVVEPGAAKVVDRVGALEAAKIMGIRTWVSFEPVLNAYMVFEWIMKMHCIDVYKIGKLNYHPSSINWHDFGHECERLCKEYRRDYYIKEDLRQEMK